MIRSYIPIGLLVFLSVAVASVPSRVRAQSKSGSPKITELEQVNPESVGFSSQRLERLHAMLQKEVDDKQLAGIVTVLARHGKIVDYQTYGKKDLVSGAPMTKDTIFGIQSMTKPSLASR